MIANASFHRRGDTQRLMNAAEVVIHEVERERVLVVLDFLGECIRQPRKAAHVHPHRKILPFDKTCRNVPSVGPSVNDRRNRADAFRWAIASLFVARIAPIELDQHRVVDLSSECQLNRSQVNVVTVRGQLDAVGEPSRQIVHEMLCVPRRAPSYAPRNNQLTVGAECGPRPHISIAKASALFFRHVFVFRVAERPDFIALYSFAWKVAKRLALILGARLTNPREQLDNGILRNSCHSYGRTNGIAFNQRRNHGDLTFQREVVHV